MKIRAGFFVYPSDRLLQDVTVFTYPGVDCISILNFKLRYNCFFIPGHLQNFIAHEQVYPL